MGKPSLHTVFGESRTEIRKLVEGLPEWLREVNFVEQEQRIVRQEASMHRLHVTGEGYTCGLRATRNAFVVIKQAFDSTYTRASQGA